MIASAPRIAIDARAVSHPQPGGFKTYTENLLRHLPHEVGRHDFFLYLDRPLTNGLLHTKPDLDLRIVRNPLPVVGVPLREQLSLPYRLVKDKIDLVHFPYATAALWSPCPYVMTIHDTIELMPTSHSHAKLSMKRRFMHLYNRYTQALTVHNAAAIVTVSENSKQDIARIFNIPADKIFVTYEAPGQLFTPLEDQQRFDHICHKYDLSQDFILGVGSADPRKNLKTLIKAFAQLPPELVARYELAIVWTHHQLVNDMLALVKQLGLTQRVKFLQHVSNQDLALLFNATSLFVFPSLYEGFGLPPLEAMACGAPVVAANNSSIPEIVGDGAVLVDNVRVPDELSGVMSQILSDETFRSFLSRQGLERANGFSWDRCARETVDIYEAVLEQTRSENK